MNDQPAASPRPGAAPAADTPPELAVCGWLVVLPNGWESLHRDQGAATQYAARSHGTVEPVYRKVKP